ncbi:hypothetical protein [Raoultella ornithinolytica]|uniref:hypothetical protein n=1 Tax=Raoultella ornithinolytica TaxID=54291 RepID=UPI0007DABC4C|nr:hypothetical protein [Raoultella ornithinolytica]MCZ0881309.1 hypothetical protein [Raoultella ornithinolytica]
MENITLIDLMQDLKNWQAMSDVPETYPQFKYPTLKTLFWQSDKHPGLSRCTRIIGKKRYINIPLFSLYLAGQLPEQQTTTDK